jgi:amino acid transporter
LKNLELSGANKPSIFVREATGLVKTFGMWSAFLITLGNLNIGLDIAQLYYSEPASIPGADVGLLLTIAFFPSILWGLIYWIGGSIMPRSGGDYVWMGRFLTGWGGFVYGFFLIISAAVSLGYNADLFASLITAQAFSVQGVIMHNSSLFSIGSFIATPVGILVTGTLVLIAGFIIGLLGNVAFYRSVTVFMILGYIGIIVAAIVTALTPHAKFINILDSYFKPNTYENIINSAASSNVFLGFSLASTISALPFAALVYGGFTSNVYVAGEIKNVKRNVPIPIFLALVVGYIYMFGMWLLSLRTFGRAFLTAVGYLAFYSPTKYPLPVPPTINFFTGIISGSPVLSAIIGLGFVAWAILIIPIYFLVLSRVLFAMSFDRLLPMRFSAINEKYHVPVYSLIFTFFAGIIVLAALAYLPTVGLVTEAVGLDDTLLPGLVAVGLLLFPVINKEVFNKSAHPLLRKVGRVPVSSIIGLIFAIYVGWATYYAIVTSPILVSAAIFPIIIVLGVALYPLVKWIRRKQGIDLDMIFKEVPPE